MTRLTLNRHSRPKRFLLNVFYVIHAIISALHGMPAQTSNKKGVCLSIYRTRALWQNGKKICSDFYTIQKII